MAESDQTPASEERRALNQATFRAANDVLRDRQATEPLELLCECDRGQCRERIWLSLSGYAHVRALATRFVVVSGHQGRDEHVEEQHDRYSIVAKEGRAAEIVRDLYAR